MSERQRLVLAGVLGAGTELAGVALLGTATWLIARAAQQPPLAALTVAVVAVRALAIAKGTLRYTERLAGHDAALGVLANLRTRVYAALSAGSRPMPRGDLLARLVSDVDGVQDLLLRCVLPAAVSGVVALAAVGFTACYVSSAALALAAGLLLAGLVVPLFAAASAARSAGRLAAARGAYLAGSVDVLTGAAELVAFGATGAALERAGRAADRVARLERFTGLVASLLGALSAALPGLTALAVCLLTLHSGHTRDGSEVLVAVLSLVALGAVESVAPLSGAAVRYAELRGGLHRIRELTATVPAPIPDPPVGPVTGPVSVVLSGVRVRYSADRPPALDGLDLALPPGHRVAVVGPSGSGKSTLLAVLAGAVTPEHGTVTVSSGLRPRPQVSSGLRPGPQVASGVFADAHVFHASIRENVTLGRSGGDVAGVLAVAGLGDFATRLDTVVGEDGGRLSGGQRQRLLLARALLAPPPVLLLDEPTEGLEPAAADRVLDDVLNATAGHTVVMVTHRLTGLARFDEVLVLVDGRVAARGRPAELDEGFSWYAQWSGDPLDVRG
jgi:ATP-binding cassette subfamily C protein CydC